MKEPRDEKGVEDLAARVSNVRVCRGQDGSLLLEVRWAVPESELLVGSGALGRFYALVAKRVQQDLGPDE